MQVYKEISLEAFEWWSGAADTAAKIREAGAWEELESILEELYPEGIDATTLNDLLWFESDWILETLGISSEEEEDEEEENEE